MQLRLICALVTFKSNLRTLSSVELLISQRYFNTLDENQE